MPGEPLRLRAGGRVSLELGTTACHRRLPSARRHRHQERWGPRSLRPGPFKWLITPGQRGGSGDALYLLAYSPSGPPFPPPVRWSVSYIWNLQFLPLVRPSARTLLLLPAK